VAASNKPDSSAASNKRDSSAAFVERGSTFQSTESMIQVVNAALYLRRPILVTGHPGTGKSSLVDAVAYELGLGEPLRWPVTSRSTLKEALYRYDALGRLQALQLGEDPNQVPDIGDYLELGPLGTAMLPSTLPRALLIDEIDKADIDLPNDLLNIFEEGRFEIPELSRLREEEVAVRCYGSSAKVSLTKGRVCCHEFPFVVMTSNGERDFPAPFLRRCLRLDMPDPWLEPDRLEAIVYAHFEREEKFENAQKEKASALINAFLDRAKGGKELLATDQLLGAIYLVTRAPGLKGIEKDELVAKITEALNVERS
jgi:MoxR-like ATPase